MTSRERFEAWARQGVQSEMPSGAMWLAWQAALASRDAEIAELVEVLKEIADLFDDARAGIYTPDSFTTQPARTLIAKHSTEKGA